VTPALVTDDVVVIDDLLGAEDFAAVRRELAEGRYESVHRQGWDKSWRLRDGSPMRGGGVYYDPAGAFGGRGAIYPTATVIDRFIDAVRRLAVEHPRVVGVEGSDWAAMFLCPWLYPAGSALSLHRDGGNYSGAFTYFAHPRWRAQWGGELLIVDPPFEAPVSTSDWWDEDDAPLPSLATCVFPRPNRLVLVGADRAHMIGRVDHSAGDHVRTSLAGFFLRAARSD
jgi:hypothetical protein